MVLKGRGVVGWFLNVAILNSVCLEILNSVDRMWGWCDSVVIAMVESVVVVVVVAVVFINVVIG